MPDTVVTIDAHDLAERPQRDAMLQCYDACTIDGHCLGWMPKLAYDQARDKGRIITCWRNADLVGFLMWATHLRQLKVYQTWVRRDARMIEHGRALVARAQQHATAANAAEIRLWCAEDLPANSFWQALGFERLTWRWSPHRVKRRHILWTRAVTLPCVPIQPPVQEDVATSVLLAPPNTRLIRPAAPLANRTA